MTNDRLIRENLCTVCHGRLKEIWQAGAYVVVCATDPSHEGHVKPGERSSPQQNAERLRSSEVLGFYAGSSACPGVIVSKGAVRWYGDGNG